jgi:hypothetical protein
MFLSTLWSALATFLLLASQKRPATRQQQHHHELVLETIRKNTHQGLIWVDLENVRGRSGFSKSHREVLEETAQWAHHYNLTTTGQVVAVADHGSLSQAYPYRYANATLAVVFSGNHQKADDVLSQRKPN